MTLLAEDEIGIDLDGERIRLRPSLRAAMRLQRRHNGFDKIIAGILAGNVTTMCDVMRESADRHTRVPDLIEEIGLKPLNIGLAALAGPLLAHVYRLAGVDLADPVQVEDKGTPSRTDWALHHERLFAIATGWLGWTPADAWDATPGEIMCAYKGRMEMLRAVFGGGEEDKPDTSAMSLDDKFKLALGQHNVRTVRRSSRAPA